METKIKKIFPQDAFFKIEPKKSGETSINLTNEIMNFFGYDNMNGDENRAIKFRVYKEDFIKGLCFIVNKLSTSHLFTSSSNASNEFVFSLESFHSYLDKINNFFKNNTSEIYNVNLLYRKDGRIYLNGLKDTNSKFNLREFLIGNYSFLIFIKNDNGDLEIRLNNEAKTETLNNDESLFTTDKSLIPYIKYLAAIKSKPFLLLAGISGTGKSRIVRQLARSCDKFDSEPWDVQKPYNYEMISVKPNWHDSTELLGYVSRVSGKPHYIVTDFLKFIVKAWMYEDKPFFLCLDEMNLAPVEQYFAEFLSVMESRKLNSETNVITSDPLLYLSSSLDEEKEMTKNMIDDIFSNLVDYENLFENNGDYYNRLELLKKQFKNDGISIPRNLIVIGTVNMDETTYTFSRKVLDRAMTIEMNEVTLTDGLNRDKEILPEIAPEQILPDAVEGYDFYEENKEVCDYVIKYLEKINEKLEGTPFKIAYRTRNDCMLYVVNSLKLCQESEDLTKDGIINRALDEVTSMKILSRIEGDKKKVGEILSELEKVIKGELNLTDSEDNKKSVSLKKLEEMNDRLTNTYYCSFWS